MILTGKMKDIPRLLVFAGTTEGRRLCEFLDRQGIDACVCVATEYGEKILDDEHLGHMEVRTGRLQQGEMAALMTDRKISIAVDATHPYAQIVSKNIEEACSDAGVEYVRLLREDPQPGMPGRAEDRAADGADAISGRASDEDGAGAVSGRAAASNGMGHVQKIFVSSVQEAAAYLKGTSGNIFVTTGSRELFRYAQIPDFRERVYARVLSTPQSVQTAADLGLEGAHLICMQGPFSVELNAATMRQCQAKYLVTKQSGAVGGYPEKEEAARLLDVTMIVVRRPQENSSFSGSGEMAAEPDRAGDNRDGKENCVFSGTLAEVKGYLLRRLGRRVRRTITLAGIGMGRPEGMTEEVRQAIREADLLIGARRMLDAGRQALEEENGGRGGSIEKPCLCEYRAEQIRTWLGQHPEYERVTVLLSGDVGFYSGAKGLSRVLAEGMDGKSGQAKPDRACGPGFSTGTLAEDANSQIRLLPGISSIQMLAARCKVGWEDAKLVSMHGRQTNLAAAVRENRRVFAIVGGQDSFFQLCRDLDRFGLGDVRITEGQQLSYPDEKIMQGKPGDFLGWSTLPQAGAEAEAGRTVSAPAGCRKASSGENSLITVLIENPLPCRAVSCGIEDGQFLRIEKEEKDSPVRPVPMTKREVRAVSLSYLQLHRDSIVYDIGAGTGSVSVECARLCPEGQVYAIERREDASDLIGRNAERFGVSNLTVLRGLAPEALEGLPAPTHAFLGGTAGNMREILQTLLRRNPRVRVVINAIALETLQEAETCLRDLPFKEAETVCVTVARAKKAGHYHLMCGQNPVWVLAAEGDGRGENPQTQAGVLAAQEDGTEENRV